MKKLGVAARLSKPFVEAELADRGIKVSPMKG